MHFRQITNPQMKMARLKSGDLQPLCKMLSSLSFFPEILFRGTPSRAANRSRAKLPFTNSRAKQPRSTDCELRSSSFPFAVPIAVPISRSVSSRSPYQFVVCWPSVRRRTGSPLGSSTDLHQVAAISQAGEGGRAMLLLSREVVAARRETARRE